MALPVSYKEFIKHPLMATMYCLIAAVVAMYIEQRVSNANQKKQDRKEIVDCRTEVYMLNVKVDQLNERMRKSDSVSTRFAATFEVLKKLGKID